MALYHALLLVVHIIHLFQCQSPLPEGYAQKEQRRCPGICGARIEMTGGNRWVSLIPGSPGQGLHTVLPQRMILARHGPKNDDECLQLSEMPYIQDPAPDTPCCILGQQAQCRINRMNILMLDTCSVECRTNE